MAADIGVIWVRGKQKYFCRWDWTAQISLIRLNKFAVARNSAGQTRTPFGRRKHHPQQTTSNVRIVVGYGMTASGAKRTFVALLPIQARNLGQCGGVYGSGVPMAINGYFFTLASNSPTIFVDEDEQDVGLRLRRWRLGMCETERRAGAKRGCRGKCRAAEQYAATTEGADIHSRAKVGAIVVRTHVVRPSRAINSL
jgi:hypothetical protein